MLFGMHSATLRINPVLFSTKRSFFFLPQKTSSKNGTREITTNTGSVDIFPQQLMKMNNRIHREDCQNGSRTYFSFQQGEVLQS